MEHSPLSDLPPELRDYIYDLALYFPDNEVLLEHVNEQDKFAPVQRTACGNCLSVLLTCRQVYVESIKRLYASNSFLSNQTSPGLSGARVFEKFIEQIGPVNSNTLEAIQLSYTLTHGTLGNGEFRQTLRQVQTIAQRIPSCSVKVCFTFLDIYKSIAIRVRLDMQAGHESGKDWIEVFEPSASEGSQDVDESIRFLQKHLLAWKQDLSNM